MNNKGFTLVEIMAVIALLAILLTGAGLVVTSVISRNRDRLQKQNIGLIEDAAITYVQTKKYYIPACVKTSAGNSKTYKTISKPNVDALNVKLSETALRSLRNDFNSLNSDVTVKNYFKGLIDVDSEKCYKIISVKTLVDEGFLEKVDVCYEGEAALNSTLVVYAQGDAQNPDGTLKAVSATHICE